MKTELLTICCLSAMLLTSLITNLVLAIKADEWERRNAKLRQRIAQLKTESGRNAARLELTGFLWNEDVVKMQVAMHQKDKLLNQKWNEAKEG